MLKGLLALGVLAAALFTAGCLGQKSEIIEEKGEEVIVLEENEKRTPSVSIGSISYSTMPLKVGETEKLKTTISETRERNTTRKFKVKAIAVRSMGNFTLGEVTVDFPIGTTSKTVEIGNIRFNTAGNDLKTKIEVYNAYTGALLTSRTGLYADTINGNNPIPDNNKKVLDVAYYSQPNGVTCGPTSVTMALKYLGKNVSANTIWDVNNRVPCGLQNPSNNVREFQRWGLYAKGTSAGSRELIIKQIDAGRPVVLHTYLTAKGHIVLVVGYDKNRGGFIINDPNGKYLGRQDSYSSASGKNIFISWNDSNLMVRNGDTWMSTASRTPFSW